MKWNLVAPLCLSLSTAPIHADNPSPLAADPNGSADLTITNNVVRTRDKVPPIGALDWGEQGAINWGANNFIVDPGNEPVYEKNYFRVSESGPNWFNIEDGKDVTFGDVLGSGFFSGTTLRIYRLVDKDGKSLPVKMQGDKNIDVTTADHVLFVGTGQVIPEGAPDFPEGGWVCTKYSTFWGAKTCRYGNLTATDIAPWLGDGKTYWYAVKAVTAGNVQSDISNEVSITPAGSTDNGPHVLCADNDPALVAKPGEPVKFQPMFFGGAEPLTWTSVNAQGAPVDLPTGLTLDPATGLISGSLATPLEDIAFVLKVTDAKGRSETRTWMINPKPGDASKEKPAPPTGLKAVAGKNGCVTLTWTASTSNNAAYYQLVRSTAPLAQQENRAYVTKETPAIEPFDYVVTEKKFDPFDLKYLRSRMCNPQKGTTLFTPYWYWRVNDPTKLTFSLVPHPKPVPAEMVDPGETCLQVKVGEGEQTIRQHGIFIGTEHGYDSTFYGQFEPGKKYRLEVWLRQDGLGNKGTVAFSYGQGDGSPHQYPTIQQTFSVTNEWKKYTYDFEGPERPKDDPIFSHQFTFTGPGTLWMDNCRIFRYDRPEDADLPYVPNATVLAELIRSQPETGPKSSHRDFIIGRNITMSSLLSWHNNSQAAIGGNTQIMETHPITLPMALTFDLHTGGDAQSRMRPWLTIQHILFSEQDWLNFIEYLAAPYDPNKDTPQSKPWAYKRTQQRGVNTPWTDEFSEIILEFGNETWQNGTNGDWLGLSLRFRSAQGGKEYGLFTRYLCETMRKSPYWQSEKLDKKIRFSLGAFYDGSVDKDGVVKGYGEAAMQANPYATILGHANYVGPKWEVGEKSVTTYDDHGVQECLVSYLVRIEPIEMGMAQAHDAIVKSGHDYDLAAYEGGPGGYGIGGEAGEISELYGNSLAMAVSAFDSWMRSYLYGWTYQNFTCFAQGPRWSSHTALSDGFRPQPGWLALTMRNRYGAGDMLSVVENHVPSYARGAAIKPEIKAHIIPLIGAYAFQDGQKYSVFVVSRKLDKGHDGVDFGDGYSPVTIHLPFSSAGKVSLHTLTGDPRWTNLKEMKVDILSKDLPPTVVNGGTLMINEQSGGGPNGMPPGSIFAYVFENVN